MHAEPWITRVRWVRHIFAREREQRVKKKKNLFLKNDRTKHARLDLERTPRRGFVVPRVKRDIVSIQSCLEVDDIVEAIEITMQPEISKASDFPRSRERETSIFHQTPEGSLSFSRRSFLFVNRASLSSLDWSSMMLEADRLHSFATFPPNIFDITRVCVWYFRGENLARTLRRERKKKSLRWSYGM